VRRGFTALALAIALAAGGIGLGACGIPLSGPSKLPLSALPAGLLAGNPAPQQQCTHVTHPVTTVYIYLLTFSGSLVKVPRCVDSRHAPTVQDVIKLLEVGPDAPDLQASYGTDVNFNSDLVSVGPKPTGVAPCPRTHKKPTVPTSSAGATTTTTTAAPQSACGLATIRLDPYFSQLTGEQPIDELAQIVFSLTESPLHVTEVRFLAPNGRPVAVETSDGRFVNRPVTIADYRHLGI
jgi:hypothetical protein